MTLLLGHISLRNPWWLLLALQPLLLWALMFWRRRKRRDDFADGSMLPWVLSDEGRLASSQLLRQVVIFLAWCSLALAMAGPRQVLRIVNEDASHFSTLQVVVDESYSMSARDVAPTRLQRAKLELHKLIARLQRVRMGIIVYAAHPHVMIPAAADKSVLSQAVDLLQVRQLPSEGSNLFAALKFAKRQLQHEADSSRAILLITDGGLSDNSVQARRALRQWVATLPQHNIHLFVLGVGTHQGAPLLNDQNGWLKRNGQTVLSRLHAARLQTLARLGRGSYAGVSDDGSDWRTLYDDGIAQLRSDTQGAGSHGDVIWRDLSPWFVLPGMLLMLLAYARVPWQWPRPLVFLLAGFLAVGFLHPASSYAATDPYSSLYGAYKAGHYQQAAEGFARLTGYRARMGEAASLFQLKVYPKAATSYIQAVLDANTDRQRAAALFNLGNCYYKQQTYAKAVQAYRGALRYRPEFTSAKTNLSYALALQQEQRQFHVAPTSRAGTGSHMAPARANTEVGKGRVSLAQTKNTSQPQRAPSDTNTPRTDEAKLLLQARPASDKIVLDKDKQWTYDITHTRNIQPQDSRFHVDGSVLWKRMYEAEEGYPAPRQRPTVLPGVAPW